MPEFPDFFQRQFTMNAFFRMIEAGYLNGIFPNLNQVAREALPIVVPFPLHELAEDGRFVFLPRECRLSLRQLLLGRPILLEDPHSVILYVPQGEHRAFFLEVASESIETQISLHQSPTMRSRPRIEDAVRSTGRQVPEMMLMA